MLLASVHLSPSISVPIAVALSAAIVWYWWRLGGVRVPASRRKIRRFSLMVMLLSMPMLVRALSFVDPAVDKKPYVVAWTAVTFMVLIVIVSAIVDAINNLRLHEHHKQDAIAQAATDMALAIRERREQSRGHTRHDEARDERVSGAGS